jgi:tetratricopeptide (TPR) repeat protein
VFEQSWQRLSTTEQTVLSRLTIFESDRFSPEAARAVAGASRQTLNALARKSLIHSHDPDDGYAIHPLYRAFAKRKLPADQTELQQAYVNYFTHLLADAVPAQFDKEKHRRLRDLLPLLPDLRACWHWALATADVELVGALEGALYRLLREVGLREGLTLFEAAWERLPTAWPENGRTLPQQITLAHLATHLGFFRIFSGDAANARLALEYALAEFDRLNITAGRDTALTALADALTQLGENEARLALWRRELALIAASADQSRQSLVLCNLGDVLYYMGQLEEARESFTRSLETKADDEPDYNNAIVMNNLGLAELALGNLAEAGRWLQKSLQIREQYPNAYRIASARLALGMLAIAERDHATARQQLETALTLYTEAGRPKKVGVVHLHLSRLALQQGDFADAEQQARQALAYAQQFQSVAHGLEGLWRWAEFLWATERQDEAQAILAYVLGHPNTSGLLAREVKAFVSAMQITLDLDRVPDDVDWQWWLEHVPLQRG